MTIASDFFFDLTPKTKSPIYPYDIVESELLPTPNKTLNVNISKSISQNNSTPAILGVSPNRNFPNMENHDFINMSLNTKFSQSSDRFKFTVIKKNNTLLSPISSRSTRKFNIVRVPKNSTYSSEDNEEKDSNAVHISLDQNQSPDEEGIINLF